jgi:23S rRNA pseudouridine1911/1915/1917 synthase
VVTVNDLQTAVATSRLKSARIRLVYEDGALIVLDKPSGLLTAATEHEKTDTLYARLNDYLRGRDSAGPPRALVVHRLDQGTSGLVLFAMSQQVQHLLKDAWSAVEKTYWAVVEGRPNTDMGTITSYLTESKSLKVFSSNHPSPSARLATTHYRLLKTQGGLSLVEVRLESGRKHQIRVHLAGLGCCVAGDKRYGATSDPCHRLALHAGRLALLHPSTGARLKFDSPLPAVLSKLFAGSTECR